MSETKRNERINVLSAAVATRDKIHLRDAAQLLQVSEMTIRRDLAQDNDELQLLGGYIVSAKDKTNKFYFLSDQQQQHVALKQRMANTGAGLIQAGDTVFFDCGTTIPFIIDAIDRNLPFTALCSALNTFLALQSLKQCKIILIGGIYHPNNAIFTPPTASHLLDEFCPNLAFISAAGLDAQQEVTCFNHNELLMKRTAIQRAQRKILVLDSSKYNQVRPARVGQLAEFDDLLSDKLPPENLSALSQAANIRCLTPE